MDLFNIDSSNLEEIIFETKRLRNVFANKEKKLHLDFTLPHPVISKSDIFTERVGNFYITHYVMNFNKDVICKINQAVENVAFYFIKKGEMIDVNKNVRFLGNTFNAMFMQEDYEGKGFYPKNTDDEAISLHLPKWYFEEIAKRYPERFEAFFSRYEKGESFYLSSKGQSISVAMHQMLLQLENRRLMGNCSEMYADAKMLELLDLLFPLQTDKSDRIQLHCKTYADREKIKEAGNILLSNHHHPPTIRALSLQVGINEKKLKYGFKEVFGNTPYGYLFEYKMDLAKRYLLDSDKVIAEIGFLCGYDSPSHFSTAFKRYFGVSPGKMREN